MRIVAHTCNPNTLEAGVGGSLLKGHPALQMKLYRQNHGR